MSRFKLFAALTIVVLALMLPVLAFAAPAGQAGTATSTAISTLTITLNPQNNSGESGTAVLTDLGNGQTKVDVTITGEPAGLSQPEHIHKGTCENLDPNPAFALQPLVNGTSTTVVQVSLSDLLANPYAINGHKSAQEITTYVFCGNITTAAATATSTTAATIAPTMAATTAPTLAATEAPTNTPTQAPTVAATTAPTVAPTEAASATPAAQNTPVTASQATPEATSTAVPANIPTTGGSTSSNILIAVLALGALALIAGILLRRSSVSK